MRSEKLFKLPLNRYRSTVYAHDLTCERPILCNLIIIIILDCETPEFVGVH